MAHFTFPFFDVRHGPTLFKQLLDLPIQVTQLVFALANVVCGCRKLIK